MNGSEVNFDGIVGLTHNYSGLAYGNVASLKNKRSPSNPRQAALQGLAKMKYLMDLGIRQAVLPPQERPDVNTLRLLGFCGSDSNILLSAFQQAPELFFACCSASSMWAANAATVSPSCDSADNRVHITPANLMNKFHRSIEPATTGAALQAIFSDPNFFTLHSPLPASQALADEGAANHTRFCKEFASPGVQLFVYGRSAFGETAQAPIKYPARQTLEASQANARIHQLPPERIVLAQQNPLAIDAGVFHNDVISVGHQNVFLYHEYAFVECGQVIEELQRKVLTACKTELIAIKVTQEQVPIEDAVASYLFNSQLVTLPDGSIHLIAPVECQGIPCVRNFLENLESRESLDKTLIKKVHYLDVRESMRNGGGPACLRLRIVLTDNEISAVNPHVFLTEGLYNQLTAWVQRHYRDRLLPEELADPALLAENRQALDELSRLLRLGCIYPFQK